MTLLAIAQRVCDEVGMPRPSAVASSTDSLGRQLFALANTELEEISMAFDWPLLNTTYNFNTVIGQSQYNLPADFRKLLIKSAYNAATYYRMRGSLTAAQWQYRRNALLGPVQRYQIRLTGNPNKLNITPTPQSVEALVYEYQKSNFAMAGAVEQPLYAVDTDVSIVDERLVRMGLKWRIKHAKGLEFSADIALYNQAVQRAYAASIALDEIDITETTRTEVLSPGYVPETGYGP